VSLKVILQAFLSAIFHISGTSHGPSASAELLALKIVEILIQKNQG